MTELSNNQYLMEQRLKKATRNRGKLVRRVMNQRREIKNYIAEITKLKTALMGFVHEGTKLTKQLHEAKGHPFAKSWQDLIFDLRLDNMSRDSAATQIKTWKETAVNWVTYDGNPDMLRGYCGTKFVIRIRPGKLDIFNYFTMDMAAMGDKLGLVPFPPEATP